MSDPPSATGLLLAGPHNARLGPAMHAFNLPAEPDVCVGSTPGCEAACYAEAFLFRLQQGRHRRNLERSRSSQFPGAMISEIRRGLVRVVRVHTSGDFYDDAYARKWAEVARACPGTAFFGDSRGWRRPEILAGLAELARMPNMSLWFNTDRDSGQAHRSRASAGPTCWAPTRPRPACPPTPTWSSASRGPAGPAIPTNTTGRRSGSTACWSAPRSRASSARSRSPAPPAASAWPIAGLGPRPDDGPASSGRCRPISPPARRGGGLYPEGAAARPGGCAPSTELASCRSRCAT